MSIPNYGERADHEQMITAGVLMKSRRRGRNVAEHYTHGETHTSRSRRKTCSYGMHGAANHEANQKPLLKTTYVVTMADSVRRMGAPAPGLCKLHMRCSDASSVRRGQEQARSLCISCNFCKHKLQACKTLSRPGRRYKHESAGR